MIDECDTEEMDSFEYIMDNIILENDEMIESNITYNTLYND